MRGGKEKNLYFFSSAKRDVYIYGVGGCFLFYYDQVYRICHPIGLTFFLFLRYFRFNPVQSRWANSLYLGVGRVGPPMSAVNVHNALFSINTLSTGITFVS